MPRRQSGKQKLTDHQKRRIEAIRQRRQEAKAKRNAKQCDDLAAQGLGESQEGLVVAHYGLNVAVDPGDGEIFRCAVRETLPENPVCGDRVMWQPADDEIGVITDILPRRNVLRRPGPYHRLQTLAANLDHLLITSSAPQFNPFLVDRYLVAASASGIDPVILLNKADLVEDEESRDDLLFMLEPYLEMEYPIHLVSVESGEGLEDLDARLRNGISAFVGQSGVGKSSLVAQWIDDEAIRIGDVNLHTGKGRHTTTVAKLYPLPGSQGGIVDSPGVRAFGLHGIEANEVINHFRDILPFAMQCQFNDCTHRHEPGCAVLEAVNSEDLDPIRLESMHRIQEGIEAEALGE
uniref:Small ribosomal subunit biogenesis GTPase RsgA n=1 Tax=Magnetococcus massalia (strain MO-1) TaxID=451514 RepID=A0A1S7LLK7_MAGMO|nr:putative ribosome biogenesis GTPase rsgA [Candidatus Magnetococcus massalia]